MLVIVINEQSKAALLDGFNVAKLDRIIAMTWMHPDFTKVGWAGKPSYPYPQARRLHYE
jgi:hypothetical protein